MNNQNRVSSVATTSRTMDLKKDQRESAVREDQLLKKHKTRDYIEEVKGEFNSITWTSKDELRLYTQIVIGSTFFLGLGVYLIDLSIQTVLNSLTWLTRITVG